MKKQMKIGMLAAAVFACGIAQARALVMMMPREMPYEFVVTEADAVVIATVTSVNKPAAPAGGAPIRVRGGIAPGTITEAKFKIDSLVADPARTELKGKEISVNLGMAGQKDLPVGKQVIMAIKNSGDGKYYVLPYSNAFSADVAKASKEFEKAGDIEKWNWGKENNGVRAVAMVRNLTPNNGNNQAMVTVSLGLRNVGKESIFVNTFPGDRCLSLKAWADGTPVAANVMNGADGVQYEPQAYVVEIKPGAVVWISQWGASPEGTAFTMSPMEGKFEMRAAYKSSRETTGGAGAGSKLWQGEVVSGEISAEMPKAPANPRPVRGGSGAVQPVRPL